MACRTVAKTSLVHKFTQVLLNVGEERIWRDDRSVRSPKLRSRRRLKLERDIERLRERLQRELDLQMALENAVSHPVESCFSQNVPRHLPLDARELLAEVAVLEMAVSNLEEQVVDLKAQIQQERHEYIRSAADCSTEDPRPMFNPMLTSRLKTHRTIDEYTVVRQVNDSLAMNHKLQDVASCLSDASSTRGEEDDDVFEDPQLVQASNHIKYEDCAMNKSIQDDVDGQKRETHKQIRVQDMLTTTPHKRSQKLWDNEWREKKEICLIEEQKLNCLSGENNEIRPLNEMVMLQIENLGQLFSLEDNNNQHLSRLIHGKCLWRLPNKLSEEMVSCMIGIYCHLADPIEATDKQVVPDNVSSPISPFGQVTSSSSSSVSELSSLQFMRDPPFESFKKEMETEHVVDPYGIVHDRVPWADIGAYKSAVEVSWMSVGNDQLEFAADALKEFRSLVEQLSKVDVASMVHEEKLAFWINVYNALMMHAYLAYGVPKNDVKFFALIQKAAYTVGGEIFNAMTIEHVLLRVKAPSHRPQIALLLALQKVHISGKESKLAIDRPEPLVSFALSCGAFSSPAVRIYRAENVQAQLQGALREYIQASVSVNKQGKLLVPKLLHSYVRDLTMKPAASNYNSNMQPRQKTTKSTNGDSENVEAIVRWICRVVPEKEALLHPHLIHEPMHQHMQSCRALQHRSPFKMSALPFDLRFRYLFFVEHHKQQRHRNPNYANYVHC